MTHNVSRSCIDKIIKVSVDVGLLFSLSSSCAVLCTICTKIFLKQAVEPLCMHKSFPSQK